MKNDARKMALENQIELAQQNAIDFTHACMTIALHDVFGVGKDRLDKVTQRKETAETIRQLQVQAVQREVSRKRVPCVLPLSEAEAQRRVEAVTSSVHSSPEMSTVLSRRRI